MKVQIAVILLILSCYSCEKIKNKSGCSKSLFDLDCIYEMLLGADSSEEDSSDSSDSSSNNYNAAEEFHEQFPKLLAKIHEMESKLNDLTSHQPTPAAPSVSGNVPKKTAPAKTGSSDANPKENASTASAESPEDSRADGK